MGFETLHSVAIRIVNLFLSFSVDVINWFFENQLSILGFNGTPADILISIFFVTLVARIIFSVNK